MLTNDEARKSRALQKKASRISRKIQSLTEEEDAIYREIAILEKKCGTHKFNKDDRCKICGAINYDDPC